MTMPVKRKYLKPGRNVQAEAVIRIMVEKGLIKETQPGEYEITRKGKSLRKEAQE